MQHTAKSMIGKTIVGVITRPGNSGQDSDDLSMIMMLQFSDGSCCELVSKSQLKPPSRTRTAKKPSLAMEALGLPADLFSQVAA